MFKRQPGALPGGERVRVWTMALGLSVAASTALANGTHTGHQFSVTEGGGATISIPIQVLRGIGGLEPQLSLNYSSGAGNGLLGVGWTLAGPSAITRCPKTPLLDGGVRGAVTFTTADRFCLDGQRLLSGAATTDATYGVAGTTYATQQESFFRITAVGSYLGQAGVPASFKVETKAGLIMEFGSSADSQVLTNPVDGSTPTISRWMLKRIGDRMGPMPGAGATPSSSANYVEFNYCKREIAVDLSCTPDTAGPYTGSQVLHYVQYTNRGPTPNGKVAVMFGYESRPDRGLQFQHGTSQVQTQRMAYIATYLGFTSPASPGERIKVYEFTYDSMKNAAGQWTRATNVSRLTRLQEVRGGVASLPRPPIPRPATDALPPLDFTYSPDVLYGKAVSQDAVISTVAPPPLPYCGGYVGAYRRGQICE